MDVGEFIKKNKTLKKKIIKKTKKMKNGKAMISYEIRKVEDKFVG